MRHFASAERTVLQLGIRREIPREEEQQLWADAISRSPKPVAVIAPSAHLGRWVLAACATVGASVPRDVAVVSCEYDSLIAETCRPQLSGVDVRGDAVGYAAAELLDNALKGESVLKKQTLVTIPPGHIVTHGSSDTSVIREPFIVKALGYIEAQACQTVSIVDVAAHAGVSRRALENAFRREIGKSPHQVVREVRMHRAHELLTRTSLPISEIASRCGYCHATQLGSHFHEVYGCTPTEYRTQLACVKQALQAREGRGARRQTSMIP